MSDDVLELPEFSEFSVPGWKLQALQELLVSTPCMQWGRGSFNPLCHKRPKLLIPPWLGGAANRPPCRQPLN